MLVDETDLELQKKVTVMMMMMMKLEEEEKNLLLLLLEKCLSVKRKTGPPKLVQV